MCLFHVKLKELLFPVHQGRWSLKNRKQELFEWPIVLFYTDKVRRKGNAQLFWCKFPFEQNADRLKSWPFEKLKMHYIFTIICMLHKFCSRELAKLPKCSFTVSVEWKNNIQFQIQARRINAISANRTPCSKNILFLGNIWNNCVTVIRSRQQLTKDRSISST